MCSGGFSGQLLYNILFGAPLRHCSVSESIIYILESRVQNKNWYKVNLQLFISFNLMYQMRKLINYIQPLLGLSRRQIVG